MDIHIYILCTLIKMYIGDLGFQVFISIVIYIELLRMTSKYEDSSLFATASVVCINIHLNSSYNVHYNTLFLTNLGSKVILRKWVLQCGLFSPSS